VKLEFSGQIFKKYSNIKFHENPYSGNRVFSCRPEDRWTGGKTGMMKLTATFCNFADVPKNDNLF
jgi:hypothetical protein